MKNINYSAFSKKEQDELKAFEKLVYKMLEPNHTEKGSLDEKGRAIKSIMKSFIEDASDVWYFNLRKNAPTKVRNM